MISSEHKFCVHANPCGSEPARDGVLADNTEACSYNARCPAGDFNDATATARKPRARSQARIDSILDAARTLLAAEGVASLSIYSVAERAEIPPSSVYHFFASVPALLEALTADVHAAFRACLQAPIDHDALSGWRDLSRLVEQRMLEIYSEDAAARQLILAQHGLTEVTQADRQHDIELGDLMHKLFDHHFELPKLPTMSMCLRWPWSWGPGLCALGAAAWADHAAHGRGRDAGV